MRHSARLSANPIGPGSSPGTAGPAVLPGSAGSRWINRQALAFAVSVFAKLLILVLGLLPIHILASCALFALPDLWILSGLLVPNTTCLMPMARRFVTAQNEVWLTIDDGPEPATTPRMLDLLDRFSAKATFFVIGEKARAHPALIREMLRRGHTLGNHTQTHPVGTFWLAGRLRTCREIDACDEALRSAGVDHGAWFRPPVGIRTLFLRRALAERERVLVGWSARGREQFSRDPKVPLRRLQRKVRPGAILLLHESATQAEQRIALLVGLLEHLTKIGYRCVLPERSALA